MKREVFESQAAFAGEKKPSMQRRCVDHDYTERMMYMVTRTQKGRFFLCTLCTELSKGHLSHDRHPSQILPKNEMQCNFAILPCDFLCYISLRNLPLSSPLVIFCAIPSSIKRFILLLILFAFPL